MYTKMMNDPIHHWKIAHWVEQQTMNLWVVGSNPTLSINSLERCLLVRRKPAVRLRTRTDTFFIEGIKLKGTPLWFIYIVGGLY